MTRPPSLGVSIFLYITGILLVILAIILLLQAFGVVKNIPKEAIWGLVLLSIGSGILTAIRRR
ncbi:MULTISPECIES: hypothetical protein [Nostocales]|uniref:Uncharacterized protein n=3 Tax=Nostocales TaxID=1161 RepID=A0A0C1R6K4_9CYAN|nr:MULTISPECIES: hypothetical protein [Nostocales]KAF3887404.1 hypothetical protein DA73_0400019335 [Tolypothrix bouteillei VB521301]MUG99943.1 hypothetical protein [Scytonema sp. UIC 10036]